MLDQPLQRRSGACEDRLCVSVVEVERQSGSFARGPRAGPRLRLAGSSLASMAARRTGGSRGGFSCRPAGLLAAGAACPPVTVGLAGGTARLPLTTGVARLSPARPAPGLVFPLLRGTARLLTIDRATTAPRLCLLFLLPGPVPFQARPRLCGLQQRFYDLGAMLRGGRVGGELLHRRGRDALDFAVAALPPPHRRVSLAAPPT